MGRMTGYILDPATLLYEVRKRSLWKGFAKWLVLFLLSIVAAFFYLWVYTSVLGLELPKLALLKKANAGWNSRIELMDRNLDSYEEALAVFQSRDEDVYRSIFGLNPVPDKERNSGFGGVNRYGYLDEMGVEGLLGREVRRLDVLTKKAYVQSCSFDEIDMVARRAGNMAASIPSVPPLLPDRSKFNISSPFGYRSDPFSGNTRRHTGVDFACKPGNPVYAVGDGVVEAVEFDFFGYGNCVVIDHGFGYKTRYAHLKFISVVEGMKVRRGENIATTGASGRASGPHLHFEVLYRGDYVNPANYYDLEMPLDEYKSMVAKAAAESDHRFMTPSELKKGGRRR